MEIPDGHFRHILHYYFQKGKNVVQAREKLYDVYGKKSLTKRRSLTYHIYALEKIKITWLR